jgi:hypothetical protein
MRNRRDGSGPEQHRHSKSRHKCFHHGICLCPGGIPMLSKLSYGISPTTALDEQTRNMQPPRLSVASHSSFLYPDISNHWGTRQIYRLFGIGMSINCRNALMRGRGLATRGRRGSGRETKDTGVIPACCPAVQRQRFSRS